MAGPVAARSPWVADGLAFAAALLTATTLARGLLLLEPAVQTAVIVGACAGLIARTWEWAGVAAGTAVLLGGLVLTPQRLAALAPGPRMAELVAIALGAAVIAAAACWLSRERHGARVWVGAAVVGLLVANLVVTTVYLDATPLSAGGLSAASLVTQVPPPGTALNDNAFYQRVLGLMAEGNGYYEAFREAYRENLRWASDPSSPLSYRLPTLFWFWNALPAKPWSIFGAWLLLATGAIAATAWMTAVRVPRPFAIPATAGLSAYFLYLGTTNAILATETWAAPIGVLALAAAVASLERARWRTWVVVAVGVALLAALVRELMVFVLVAGVVSAAFAPARERRYRLAAWAAGLAAFASAYVLHAVRVRGALSHTQRASAFLHGGARFALEAFSWASVYLGGIWVPLVFAVLAVVGAGFAASAAHKALLLTVTLAPLAAFLVVGNGATSDAGVPVNYWAPVVVPLMIALAPWSAGAVPGWARRGAGQPNTPGRAKT